MGTRQRNRRWTLAGLAIIAVLALAGCGRVDLEDLTPEAVRTQQALNPPTPTRSGSSGTPAAGETPGAGGGASDADLAAGMAQYNTWCSGCHDGGRAKPIKGQTFEFSAIEDMLRNGTGGHPKYSPTTELTDNQFNDILAYIASQPAP